MRNKWQNIRGEVLNKLQDACSETLIETLASILIGALSIALLFGTVMASDNIDRTAQKADDEFYTRLNAAEERTLADPALTDSTVKVKYTSPAGASTEAFVDVIFYDGKGAWSFVLKP